MKHGTHPRRKVRRHRADSRRAFVESDLRQRPTIQSELPLSADRMELSPNRVASISPNAGGGVAWG